MHPLVKGERRVLEQGKDGCACAGGHLLSWPKLALF